ncbi:hypothetical protein ACFV9C_38110 [Kribbella sp. NPDC059898]|uniref:hypothetical protein n=1 Tax=Kribbella sp. NPDC059898 TaxID=3346995 RepID=UPI003647C045
MERLRTVRCRTTRIVDRNRGAAGRDPARSDRLHLITSCLDCEEDYQQERFEQATSLAGLVPQVHDGVTYSFRKPYLGKGDWLEDHRVDYVLLDGWVPYVALFCEEASNAVCVVSVQQP